MIITAFSKVIAYFTLNYIYHCHYVFSFLSSLTMCFLSIFKNSQEKNWWILWWHTVKYIVTMVIQRREMSKFFWIKFLSLCEYLALCTKCKQMFMWHTQFNKMISFNLHLNRILLCPKYLQILTWWK